MIASEHKQPFADITSTAEHILIVDDKPAVALYLREALESLDNHYRVSIAQSGKKALEILQASPIDLLITDLRMPGISGLDLIRWVRASSPDTRTILITAYGDDKVKAEARRLEAYRYLTKPFDITDFRQAVQDALEDVIVSQPGFTILSDRTFDEITEELDRLRHEINAHAIILSDMQGQRIGEVGASLNIDTVTLLSLLAGSLSIDNELSHHFGSGQGVSPSYHQGKHFEIYWTPVNKDFFLVIIYDRRIAESRMGLVRLYTRRAIEALNSTLAAAETAEPPRPLDADFGEALMTELDSLFDEPSQRSRQKPSSRSDSSENESDHEIFSLREAIEQGLIPPDWGNHNG